MPRDDIGRSAVSVILSERTNLRGKFMFRTCVAITAVTVLSVMIVAAPTPAPAQTPATPAPAAAPAAPAPASKMKMSREKLKEMRAKWNANKPKLKVCRADARKKGLVDDDRWFFIEECMAKS